MSWFRHLVISIECSRVASLKAKIKISGNRNLNLAFAA